MHACYTEEAIIIFGRKVKEQNASEYNKQQHSNFNQKIPIKTTASVGTNIQRFPMSLRKKKIMEIKHYNSVKIYKEELEELRKDHSTTSQILT